jgi:hypothetical protein
MRRTASASCDAEERKSALFSVTFIGFKYPAVPALATRGPFNQVLTMSSADLLTRITIDPQICHGKPCVRGLRYPVEFILEMLSSDTTPEELLAV